MIVNNTIINNGVDTSDATATAADIASGKTAYVCGEKKTGTAKVIKDVVFGEMEFPRNEETRISTPWKPDFAFFYSNNRDMYLSINKMPLPSVCTFCFYSSNEDLFNISYDNAGVIIGKHSYTLPVAYIIGKGKLLKIGIHGLSHITSHSGGGISCVFSCQHTKYGILELDQQIGKLRYLCQR